MKSWGYGQSPITLQPWLLFDSLWVAFFIPSQRLENEILLEAWLQTNIHDILWCQKHQRHCWWIQRTLVNVTWSIVSLDGLSIAENGKTLTGIYAGETPMLFPIFLLFSPKNFLSLKRGGRSRHQVSCLSSLFLAMTFDDSLLSWICRVLAMVSVL